MTNTQKLALKIATVLWIIWGLVHALAGTTTIIQDTSNGFAAMADAIDPALLAADYHPAVEGILNQHGWNLLWIGVVTTIGSLFIWCGNITAIWVTAMVDGLADMGYLLFVDLPGFVNFVPGTVMTIIAGSAILLSFRVWLPNRTPAPIC